MGTTSSLGRVDANQRVEAHAFCGGQCNFLLPCQRNGLGQLCLAQDLVGGGSINGETLQSDVMVRSAASGSA